jgi:hypothetical protein
MYLPGATVTLTGNDTREVRTFPTPGARVI